VALMKVLVDEAGMSYLAANGATIVACSMVNFLVSDWFVFRAVPAASKGS
jgi:putative flippase GtrA